MTASEHSLSSLDATPDKALLDILDCGVALFDHDERLIYWNQWLEHHSRRSFDEVKGRTLEDVFGDALSVALRETICSGCRDGMSGVLSNQLHRHPLPLYRPGSRTDEPVEQSILVRPLPQSSGRASAACVMQVSNVSAAVRRERHLRESQAQLRLRNRALEASSQGIIIVDAVAADRPVIYTNQAFSKITGYTAEEVLGRNCRFLQGPQTEQPGLDVIRQAISNKREAIAVVRNYRKDGSAFWNEVLISPVFDSKGTLTNFVGVQRDISARRLIEEERDRAISNLRQANERLSQEEQFTTTILRTIGALVAVVDRRGQIISFNRACETATGLAEADVLKTRLSDLIPDESVAPLFRLDGAATTPSSGVRTGLYSRSGDQRIVRWSFSTLQSADGVATHLICTGIDVTERDRAYALLEAERAILELVARAESLDVLMERLCNMVEAQLTGFGAALALLEDGGETFDRVIGPSMPKAYIAAMTGSKVGPAVGTCGAVAYSGSPRYTFDTLKDENWRSYRHLAETLSLRSCWFVPILSSTQTVLGTFGVHGPVPRLPDDAAQEVLGRAARIASIAIERHMAQERIQHLALYDQLTGLANRVLLSDRMETAIRGAERKKSPLGLLFIDLDGFKPVNDAYGHDAGDAVLEAVGRRLTAVLRASDTAARIGGDEFVVLAEGCQGTGDVAHIADKILSALRQPIVWDGKDVFVGASIGVALYPDHAPTADTLLTEADNAMYHAKQRGKNQWSLPPARNGHESSQGSSES